MNAPLDPRAIALARHAIGQPLARKEDAALLRGEGQYTQDVSLPGQAYAVMVRSPYAHGRIRAIGADEARVMPGVLGVYTGADLLAAGMTTMPTGTVQKNRDGTPMATPPQPPLATDKVRYAGEPVAFVVADTPARAKDAAEAVLLDIEPLPAVTDAAEAAAAGAPLVHDGVPGNLVLDYHYGDRAAVAAAFAGAAHVTRLSIRNNRVVVSAMEPRAALGEFDRATGRYTLRVGCQGVWGLRASLKGVLGVPAEQVRVLAGSVGGSFGMKSSVYPEYPCVLLAARLLGRPVRWADERGESFLSDSHGRAHDVDAELALDADGRFLAIRVHGLGNLGAYLSNATTIPPTVNTMKNMVGVYATPLIEVSARCVFTNTTPVGFYRGAGRPEGNLYMERLVNAAAAEMGIDPADLRRRNHIQPGQMPYRAPSGMEYDSGNFPEVLDRALALADWDGFPARRAESRRAGKLRGRGIGQYLEVTAPPTQEMGGIRFEPDGTVTIITGTLDYGQGHASAFAQVLCDRLGVPFEQVRLLQGDTDQLIAGGGTGGSKSMMASGAAIVEASALVAEAGRRLAADVLEASPGDIEFSVEPGGGRFTIAGTDRGIGIMELASALRDTGNPGALDVRHIHASSPSAYPNGCHVAEVEIEEDTGVVRVVRYAMVNDFGVVINPMLVEGQAHGGIAQGIGQALCERVAYDEDGQMLTGSYMDYALPRADDVPVVTGAHHGTPARSNVLGVKGCGEAGCAGSLPAVMNAVVDALSSYGVAHIDMPATPQAVWRAMQAAAGR